MKNIFNRQRIVLSLIITAVMIAGCVSPVDPAAERAILLEADRSFARLSDEEGPAEAFRTFMSENGLQLPRGREPVTGRQNIYEGMAAAMPFSLNWIPMDGSVSPGGDFGWTWGTYVAGFSGPDGEPLSSSGKYLNVWTRDAAGSWKVLVDMGNVDPPAE